jgi:lysophospholipase L1-like esterase
MMPDFVILLVGTNDVLSSLDPKLAEFTRKIKHIPHEPSLHHYSNNITSIINNLKQETNSKIAIVSLPVVGEDIDSIKNTRISEYNTELKKIAENENIAYLPVYEKQYDYLINKIRGKGKDSVNSTKMAFQTLFLHYLLFMSLDSISSKNGFLLLTDGIHQNSLGAKFIADEIENFIRESN